MRKLLVPLLVICGAILLIAKLFYLQIIDESFLTKSENNAIKAVFEYPERGYIFDRNKKLLVANQPSYDIMVVPNEIKDLDTLAFCNTLGITKEYFDEKLAKAIVYSPRLPSPLLSQLTKKEFANFQEKARHFNGFYIQKRSLRDYQVDYGANVFGYIRQINEFELKRSPYYKSGELIGIRGVEQAYEKELRGVRGVTYYQKNKFNKVIGSFKNGQYDTLVVKGKDITITIDGELQEYVEKLMVNKRGGMIAIEPKTGEILALVTAPSYDPSMLVGKNRSKNYVEIEKQPGKPFFDNVLQGQFAPGSPFKILTGLIGLQEGVINEQTRFSCSHGFYVGRRFVKCHDAGSWNLHPAIAKSCNTYFSQVYMRIIDKYNTPEKGIDAWAHHLNSFGLGNYLGYDLPVGQKGRIPTSEFYDKMYPNGSWNSKTNVSNAIGQGEVELTPIQLANVICAVANKGYFYTPHIIKSIEGEEIDKNFVKKKQTTIESRYFDPVIAGMYEVYQSGTASRLRVPGIEICGKTGTVENYIVMDGVREKLKDHSVFVAFAPKDDPKIVVAVYIQNGGWGASYAGPIASLAIEKYLRRDTIMRKDLEKRMLDADLSANYILRDLAEKKKKEKLEAQKQTKNK